MLQRLISVHIQDQRNKEIENYFSELLINATEDMKSPWRITGKLTANEIQIFHLRNLIAAMLKLLHRMQMS
jgi:hypothetical protein